MTSDQRNHVLFTDENNLSWSNNSELQLIRRELEIRFHSTKIMERDYRMILESLCEEALCFVDERSSIFWTVAHLPQIVTAMNFILYQLHLFPEFIFMDSNGVRHRNFAVEDDNC
ncbi:hypothetical protein TNCV_3074251 [Trichonephila clavipes]|uniref:Uncharacterized protein n=1 Tax=Trichonephila clavipes TaxID=2585209 RepID=A0A8X6SK02_TRICX|nr:hypothetical protein TNCV_3074251 [Trichonephila clavipes]